jgi:hypothetical protein
VYIAYCSTPHEQQAITESAAVATTTTAAAAAVIKRPSPEKDKEANNKRAKVNSNGPNSNRTARATKPLSAVTLSTCTAAQTKKQSAVLPPVRELQSSKGSCVDLLSSDDDDDNCSLEPHISGKKKAQDKDKEKETKCCSKPKPKVKTTGEANNEDVVVMLEDSSDEEEDGASGTTLAAKKPLHPVSTSDGGRPTLSESSQDSDDNSNAGKQDETALGGASVLDAIEID